MVGRAVELKSKKCMWSGGIELEDIKNNNISNTEIQTVVVVVVVELNGCANQLKFFHASLHYTALKENCN